MGTGQLLVIQGEEALRAPWCTTSRGKAIQLAAAAEARAARALLAQQRFDVAITDLRHPQDNEGMELVRHVHRAAPGTAILILTQGGTFDSALEAFRSGAHDYLLKPFPLEHLGQKVANILHFRRLVRSRSARDDRPCPDSAAPVLIGCSHAIAAVGRLVRKVAASPSTVLITGESGTGKELVARALHWHSGARGLFLPVNMAAIPEPLLESDLFGHERGAFTGAHSPRAGAFRGRWDALSG